jgi:hypothetical protein
MRSSSRGGFDVSPLQGSGVIRGPVTRAFSPGYHMTGFQPSDGPRVDGDPLACVVPFLTEVSAARIGSLENAAKRSLVFPSTTSREKPRQASCNPLGKQ